MRKPNQALACSTLRPHIIFTDNCLIYLKKRPLNFTVTRIVFSKIKDMKFNCSCRVVENIITRAKGQTSAQTWPLETGCRLLHLFPQYGYFWKIFERKYSRKN